MFPPGLPFTIKVSLALATKLKLKNTKATNQSGVIDTNFKSPPIPNVLPKTEPVLPKAKPDVPSEASTPPTGTAGTDDPPTDPSAATAEDPTATEEDPTATAEDPTATAEDPTDPSFVKLPADDDVKMESDDEVMEVDSSDEDDLFNDAMDTTANTPPPTEAELQMAAIEAAKAAAIAKKKKRLEEAAAKLKAKAAADKLAADEFAKRVQFPLGPGVVIKAEPGEDQPDDDDDAQDPSIPPNPGPIYLGPPADPLLTTSDRISEIIGGVGHIYGCVTNLYQPEFPGRLFFILAPYKNGWNLYDSSYLTTPFLLRKRELELVNVNPLEISLFHYPKGETELQPVNVPLLVEGLFLFKAD